MTSKQSLFALIILIVLPLFYFGCSKDEAIPGYKTQNVIIVVVDGARYTETWGYPTHQFIPHRYDMLQEGVMCSRFYNQGYTFTNAGHTAITTGVYQNINNGGAEYPQNPSVFQVWRKEFAKPATDAWVVATKDKLEILSDCNNTVWHGQCRPMTDCGIAGLGTGYRDDSTTFSHVKTILGASHPRLMLINFKQPDAAGHSGDSLAYLQGIMDTDNYVYQLWNFIQNDPVYKNKTTLLVTNDHGRHTAGHLDGFISHADSCDGCRHIELLGLGPDFKKNYICDKPYSQIDLANTVAELMGFKMALSQGRVIEDFFTK